MKIISFGIYFVNGTRRFRTTFSSPTLAGCASSLPIHFLTTHTLKKHKYMRASALHSCFKGFEIRLRVLCHHWPFVWIIDHEKWKKAIGEMWLWIIWSFFSDLDCRVRAVLLIYFLNIEEKKGKNINVNKRKEPENVFLDFCMK